MVVPGRDVVCGLKGLRLCSGFARLLEGLVSSCDFEVAGFIVGGVDGDYAYSFLVVFGCNVSDEPSSRFLVNGMSTYRAVVEAESRGLNIIGVFHTHPCCSATPSGLDLEGMRAWPIVWLIAGRDGLRAWRRCNGVEEVEIVIEDRECVVVVPKDCRLC